MAEWVLLAACGALAVVTGILTKQVQSGIVPFWVAVFPSIVNGLSWGYVSKTSQNLPRLSVAFDIVLSVAYMLGLMIMGERLTGQQAVGFLVAVAGLTLMH